MSGILNEFIKGVFWGFVAFVHFALITVLTFRFTLNCLPHDLVSRMACLPGPGPEQCPASCEPSSDLFFYGLVVATTVAALLLPLGFGILWAVKSRRKIPV